MPKDHENDILSAELRGKQAKDKFIQERLEKGEFLRAHQENEFKDNGGHGKECKS